MSKALDEYIRDCQKYLYLTRRGKRLVVKNKIGKEIVIHRKLTNDEKNSIKGELHERDIFRKMKNPDKISNNC